MPGVLKSPILYYFNITVFESKMVADNDLLSLLYINICNYFSGDCPPGKCSLVRKEKERLGTCCDFSITLNFEAQRKHLIFSRGNDLNAFRSEKHREPDELALHFAGVSNVDSHASKKVMQNLIDLSANWPLRIANCSINYERLCIILDKVHSFRSSISCIISAGFLYGKINRTEKEVLLTSDHVPEDEWLMNLTDYRVHLVSQVLKNLLIDTGNSVSNDANSKSKVHYHVSSKSSTPDTFNGILICCEAVIDVQKKCKEKEKSSEDYLRQRCNELREMSRQKHGMKVDCASWNSYFEKIGKAAVQIDLLSVRPSRALTLNFHEDCNENNRNAPFVLYNCARLAALQEQFHKKCTENIYPPLVPLEEIDFSLLVKEEEWELLTSYLLMYPQVLRSAIEHIDEGKPTPNLICHFLYSLCGCYSSYYRRVRILTEPREQLLPVMFARIYLLKAIEIVLHNGLRILGIEPVRYM